MKPFYLICGIILGMSLSAVVTIAILLPQQLAAKSRKQIAPTGRVWIGRVEDAWRHAQMSVGRR
jgi:hypothetical protein